jgi:hypothetical protein
VVALLALLKPIMKLLIYVNLGEFTHLSERLLPLQEILPPKDLLAN